MASFLRVDDSINMDRGDGIIRWSPSRSRDEFITANITYCTLSLNKVVGKVLPENVEYKKVAQHSKFVAPTAYDWAPSVPGHDLPGLVAVGTKLGEVHLLRVDDDSDDSITLPCKVVRPCHAVAFNTQGLLAVGLDRIRNDACLQIWDINQRLSHWDPTKRGLQDRSPAAEPYMRMEPSVAVSACRWFEDQPQTLVIGIKNNSMKIHDLRDPAGAVQTFATRSTNNLAINHKDPNYFATSSLDAAGIMVWDRRASSRETSSRMYNDAIDMGDLPWGCVLKLNQVIDPLYDSAIRSLRYSRDHSGLLGALSSSGELNLIYTEKEPKLLNADDNVEASAELLQVESSCTLAYPRWSDDFKYSKDEQIVSFDWVPARSSFIEPRVITRKANHQLGVLLKPSTRQNLTMNLLDPPAKSKKGNAASSHVFTKEEATSAMRPLLNDPVTAELDFTRSRPSTATSIPNAPGSSSEPVELCLVRPGRNDNDEARVGGKERRRKSLALPKFASSRERHEKLLSKVLKGKQSAIDAQAYVNELMLARIKKGYLFNCKRNVKILEDDPWLQDVWTWLEGAEEAVHDGGMVSGHLDLAYMGVQNIWNNDLGKSWRSRMVEPIQMERPGEEQWARALEDLNSRHGRNLFDSTPTTRPHHRKMCLAICGWGKSGEELEQDLLGFEARGLYTKAAAWALFEKKPKRAVTALQRGGKDLMFIGLALSVQINSGSTTPLAKEDWGSLTPDLTDIQDDPYLRAIYALTTTGDWRAIANESSLPLRDRVGVALHNLGDVELPNWLNRQTKEAVETGDIEGVVLTGITGATVTLLSNYIAKFNDIQTTCLLIHFGAPLYMDDYRIWQWRTEYQDLHNKNKLFVQRCHFDVGSTKLSRDRKGATVIKPKPRQVTLRCMHCDTALANDLDNTASRVPTPKTGTSLFTDRNALHSSSVHAGICCPKCGKHLPRCGICLLTLGMPRSDKDLANGGLNGSGSGAMERLKNFMSFCMKCDHSFHADHARGWFKVHNECPVPECHCACNVDGGGMAGCGREDSGRS